MKVLPYQSGKYVEGSIKLSSNESHYGVCPEAIEVLAHAKEYVYRYPDSTQRKLKEALTAWYDVDESHFIVGNGSDEILSFITQSLLNVNDHTLSALETFSIYHIVSQIAGAEFHTVPLQQGFFDLPQLVHEAQKHIPRIIFLCNPNNPTGTCFTTQEIKHCVSQLPEQSYVVLDEAYIDFAEDEFHTTIQDKLSWHPNIILLRTFSKIFALGGLRLGIGITSPSLAAEISQVRMPFNVNAIAQEMGVAVLQNRAYYDRIRTAVIHERKKQMKAYTALGFEYFQSQANFIALTLTQSKGADNPADYGFTHFASHKIMVRSLTSFHIPNAIRITIGTEEENKKVCEVLSTL